MTRARWQRLVASLIVVVGIPGVLSVSTFLQDAPIRPGEPSPRTVVAPQLIRIDDPEATSRAQRAAEAAVQPVLVEDSEASAAIVQRVRDVFTAVQEVRRPSSEQRPASRSEQVEALIPQLPMLDEEAIERLVALSDQDLGQVSDQAVAIAQAIALQRITEESIPTLVEGRLRSEIAVRSFPRDIGTTVVHPVVADALRPTVRVDEEATAAQREEAADAVEDVVRTYLPGQAIVTAGEVPDELALAALRRSGLEGAQPLIEILQAAVLVIVLTAVVSLYLRSYRLTVWKSGGRLVLLACLALLFTGLLEAVAAVDVGGSARFYLIPVGALAMLTTILFDPPVGVLMVIPTTALVAFDTPAEGGVVAFAAIAGLVSVPLVSRLSARGDLRRAAWQSTAAYIILAGAFAAVFSGAEHLLPAMLAGLIGGVLTAVITNGALPLLESTFGILTATSLLDLADRNHPLLRELEQKALGSYNHSIMVATLCERACRAIGADSLLASVGALYHDIGKVRRPYFFVENQFGIANPHDELEPRISAVIIQEHVTDGVTMASKHRLPPEVVDGIATHHGTTLVTYFHRKAVEAAGSVDEVDEDHYRYKGRKPHTRELAVLMLADCCEGASRAAAQADRNLSRASLENIVHTLVAERVEDGQLDETTLTFNDLRTVQESFIETLVGVYHPRITYPAPVGRGREALESERSGDGAKPPPAREAAWPAERERETGNGVAAALEAARKAEG